MLAFANLSKSPVSVDLAIDALLAQRWNSLMFELDTKTLADSRVQLHLAAQLIGGSADALLERAADDSHANIGWQATSSELVGRTKVSISLEDLTVRYIGDAFALQGATLDEAVDWLSSKIGAGVGFRGYDGMPEHDISRGAAISIPPAALSVMADCFSLAQRALSGNGELRIWPHHFDMGFWQPSQHEGKSVGGGFSLGDNHYDGPYFYMNPYGVERPQTLPPLKHGHWSEHWFGAVLTAAELQQAATTHSLPNEQFAAEFVTESRSICDNLITG
ncbi:MAG: hypothetical protein Aurels2KO_38490 [Aureliella sp.]